MGCNGDREQGGVSEIRVFDFQGWFGHCGFGIHIIRWVARNVFFSGLS
jgi:hypothetical protein